VGFLLFIHFVNEVSDPDSKVRENDNQYNDESGTHILGLV